MVILSLTFAMLYGPWQLWVLASPTRTIRFRTVAQAVAAGAVVTLPAAVLIEWTVDPFSEDVVRLRRIIDNR